MMPCQHQWRHVDGFYQVGDGFAPEIICTKCRLIYRKEGDYRMIQQGILPAFMQDIATKYGNKMVTKGMAAETWDTGTEDEYTVGITCRAAHHPKTQEMSTTITMELNGVMARFLTLISDLDGGTVPKITTDWIDRNDINGLLEALEHAVAPENMP